MVLLWSSMRTHAYEFWGKPCEIHWREYNSLSNIIGLCWRAETENSQYRYYGGVTEQNSTGTSFCWLGSFLFLFFRLNYCARRHFEGWASNWSHVGRERGLKALSIDVFEFQRKMVSYPVASVGWVPKGNQTSVLQIPRSDALPLSHSKTENISLFEAFS